MLHYLEDRRENRKNLAFELEEPVLKFYLLYIEKLIRILIICTSDFLFIQQNHNVQVMELFCIHWTST